MLTFDHDTFQQLRRIYFDFWVKTEKRLRLMKKRDRIKNKWAKERGYKMIRIDYTEQNQIKKILLSKFRGIR